MAPRSGNPTNSSRSTLPSTGASGTHSAFRAINCGSSQLFGDLLGISPTTGRALLAPVFGGRLDAFFALAHEAPSFFVGTWTLTQLANLRHDIHIRKNPIWCGRLATGAPPPTGHSWSVRDLPNGTQVTHLSPTSFERIDRHERANRYGPSEDRAREVNPAPWLPGAQQGSMLRRVVGSRRHKE